MLQDIGYDVIFTQSNSRSDDVKTSEIMRSETTNDV